jgi:hypothetical protein
MKKTFSDIISFITRHAVWITAILLGLAVLSPFLEIYNKVIIIIILLGVALGWSNLAVFSFTKINLTKKIMSGDDGASSASEQIATAIIIAGILLGVHILVGLAFYILTLNV